MSRRLAKQLAYGSFYLAIVLGISLFVYFSFIRSGPSCMNGRQDAGEEGVDCGGVCSNTCLPTSLRTIEIVDQVRLFRSHPGTLEVLAKIQNGNSEFASPSFTYVLNVHNEAGDIVDTVTGQSFIYGSDVKYISIVKNRITYAPAYVELTILSPRWVKASDYQRPLLSGIQDQTIDVSSTTVAISGRIVNLDSVTIARMVVTALFYDSLGLPIGISHTEIGHTVPEERKPFTVLHPAFIDVAPEKTQIFISAERQ